MNIECTKSRGVWKYMAEEFSFKFIDEKLHTHATLIVQPKHIKILQNKSELSPAQLKQSIIDTMFAQENADVREHNNKVARLRRAKKK
jgi:hypothetical protein